MDRHRPGVETRSKTQRDCLLFAGIGYNIKMLWTNYLQGVHWPKSASFTAYSSAQQSRPSDPLSTRAALQGLRLSSLCVETSKSVYTRARLHLVFVSSGFFSGKYMNSFAVSF